MLDHTVKAPPAEPPGYDGGKKIVGSKRPAVVVTDGRPPTVNLTLAELSDRAGLRAFENAGGG
jgi:hypothetical protein